ncbi:DUF6602 domain-containing protein [Gramella sp. AN32]|uniref:DUF6602 domain-containing protein n=1 Tax=Christiangramia antarctica TaxID=2058158 RepID=A0ABW5XDH5_9FLAO|nr:DUF6602 domain-containing protein [Gramella sp. AN32]MCM4157621.1 hypothetical protein [Gramella sp. AN32]
MNNIDFLELIKFESQEIDHLFKKASIEGKGTSQEVSDRREDAFHTFLQKFFPFPYRIAKGNIIDSFQRRSQSIDGLILNPCHPHTVSAKKKHSIIFADGVDAAIELKPTLNQKKEIHRSLQQIQSVKKLRRQKFGLLEWTKKYDPEYIETAKQIPSIIFCNNSYSDLNKLFTTIVQYYVDNNIKWREQFDMIVINNRGILYNCRKNMYVNFKKEHEGLFFKKYDSQTLAVFLMWLNKFPQCDPRIGEPVLQFYYKEEIENASTDLELNKKLIDIG